VRAYAYAREGSLRLLALGLLVFAFVFSFFRFFLVQILELGIVLVGVVVVSAVVGVGPKQVFPHVPVPTALVCLHRLEPNVGLAQPTARLAVRGIIEVDVDFVVDPADAEVATFE
jgi:hypothetical protein